MQREDPSDGWVDDVAQAETSDTVLKKTASDEDGAEGANEEEEKDDEERTEERVRDRHTRGNSKHSVSVRSQASVDANQRDDDVDVEGLERRYRLMQIEFERRENEL